MSAEDRDTAATRRTGPEPRVSVMYLCYQGIGEPLTQTQVVAYLEGLAGATYEIILVTFEPRQLSRRERELWRRRLRGRGIIWYPLRYHKRPSAVATAWDVCTGAVAGLWLARRHRVRLLHARSHVAGLMALVVKQLTGARFLFDIRGFMAEEYVDAGMWPEDGVLFRITKRVERVLVEHADAAVVLTSRAERQLRAWYPEETTGKPVEVIPCCVDLRRIPWPKDQDHGAGAAGRGTVVAYVGKLGGAYLAAEMSEFITQLAQVLEDVRWQVWTQTDPAVAKQILACNGSGQRARIAQLAPTGVLQSLARTQVGLAFYKRGRSEVSRSPTKIGEYLATGVIVVATAGIGDVDALLNGSDGKPVGVIVRETSEHGFREAIEELVQLMRDPETPGRCREVAERDLDLETVGWQRYRRLYSSILDDGH